MPRLNRHSDDAAALQMISAIVLAAGQATRFGQCKQLMRLGEKAMLQHVLDNLAQSKIDEVVVVLGARGDEIREQIQFGKARVLINPDYANGMSTSIQAGLRAINAEAAMIVLADQPLVTSRTLDLLIDEYRRSKPNVVIPTYNGFRGNPVIVDRSLFAEMMTIRGDIGCRSIFGNHPVHLLPVDDRGVVTDIDTPEDIGVAQTLLLKRQGVIDVPMQCYSGGVLDVFIEPNLPKPQMKEAIDPICNMTVEIATAKFTTEREGRRYYFCCAHCLRTFEKAHVA